tara:strand:- start:456 stop:2030 length:1575 start_codon:yes stop_codon:yes gene_type:complete
MKASTNSFPDGKKVTWGGYYDESDGGDNWGIVKTGAHTEDGFTVFTLADGKYIQANISKSSLNVKKAGAKGDGTFVNDTVFATVLAYANANKIPQVLIPSGIFRTDTPTLITSGVTLKGYNQSGVKILTTSGVYFSQIAYYGTGACIHIQSNSGPNSVADYSASTVDGLQIRYFGASQATSYGVQIGTVAKEALQVVVKNCLIQNFGRGIYSIGSWNVQATDVYIVSTRNATANASPLTFGVYIDCETRAITSNYLTRVFVQACDVGFYIQGVAAYSGMTDVYTDACNTGYYFNGANLSPARGWSIKGMGLEAPKYKGLIVNSTTVHITQFDFVEGIAPSYDRIVQVENSGSLSITGGHDITTGSYGAVDAMNVDATSDLLIIALEISRTLGIKGDGAVKTLTSTSENRGSLERYPSSVDVSIANRDNQFSGFSQYNFTPIGSTQAMPQTTTLNRVTFITTDVDVGDTIDVVNPSSGAFDIVLRCEGAAAGCGIVHPSLTQVSIKAGTKVSLLKRADGKLQLQD